MSTTDGLDQYLQKVRDERPGATQGEAEAKVEAILDELNLPWRAREGDSWEIDSDVGTVYAGLNEDDEVLTFSQSVGPVTGKPKRNGEFYRELLIVNRSTMGACFAIDDDQGEDWLIIIARLAAARLDKEEVAMALTDVFATAKLFDMPSAGQ